jgi:hypothetical protein
MKVSVAEVRPIRASCRRVTRFLIPFIMILIMILWYMISTKQRTIAVSLIAIAAVFVLFAAGPLVTTHQAHAFWGRVWGWGGGWEVYLKSA